MEAKEISLQDLLAGTDWAAAKCEPAADFLAKDRPIRVVYDSRQAGRNCLFVAMEGLTVDGHRYCSQAYESGCRLFLVNQPVDLPPDALVFTVENTRAALPIVAANFFDHPAKELRLIGITGTKGKTTTCLALAKILNDTGHPAASIGTEGAIFGDLHIETGLTTPESFELQSYLRTFADAGARYAVMEVSSTGLKFHRTDGLRFEYGIFTNFASDHVGRLEHPSLEDYRDSKARFFGLCDTVLINRDDALADYFADFATGKIIFYSCAADAAAGVAAGEPEGPDIYADRIQTVREEDGGFRTSMLAHLPEEYAVSFPLLGRFNAENILPAMAVALRLGLAPDAVCQSLKNLFVPGRTEVLNDYPGVLILNDIAHNGLSIDRLLGEMRPFVKPGSRLMVLLSTISYRTDIRRKDMAEAAAGKADVIMLSTSWVGHEDPNDLIEDMASYLTDFKGLILKEPDRPKAVEQLINLAEPGDAILLSELGPDNYLLIGNEKIPYTDKEAVKAACQKKLASEEV